MADQRRKDANWNVCDADGTINNWEGVHAALLMDLRDELKLMRVAMQQMNTTLQCPNFLGIPRTLRTISRKLPAKKRKKPQ